MAQASMSISMETSRRVEHDMQLEGLRVTGSLCKTKDEHWQRVLLCVQGERDDDHSVCGAASAAHAAALHWAAGVCAHAILSGLVAGPPAQAAAGNRRSRCARSHAICVPPCPDQATANAPSP